MSFGDLLAGLILAVCGLGLGVAVFRHFVGEGILALTLAAVVGLILGAGFAVWLRTSLTLRRHDRG